MALPSVANLRSVATLGRMKNAMKNNHPDEDKNNEIV